MSTTIIQIVDNGANCKYKLSPSSNMLGRRYDNNADFIQVQFPEVEIQSGTTCIMMVEDLQGNVLDHIEVKNNELTPIYNNISQNISINIGFYFSGDNNYIKNSEYQLFRFCDALKPDGFVPVEPVQSGNIDKLIQQGVIDVRWKEGTNNVLEIVRLDSKNNTELELSPFVQEQSDLAETDTSSETFVKNKSTKYLENEGDDGSSPYATEKYVDEHSVSADAVLYTPQTLTEEQQAQARTNIGVTGGEPIAEAIRDNTTQIVPTSGGLKIGGASKATLNSIAIGRGAEVSQTNNAGIAIGRNSNASALLGDNIAIGDGAIASGRNSIQLGRGINNSNNSLQIEDDNIYKTDTHTATFQNLQIDGVDEYPTLSGADAPTTTTVGKVKQFYVETTTPALYYCSSITGTGTTEDPYVYNWTQAGGADEELRNNTVQIVGENNSFSAGGANTMSLRNNAIAIGKNAKGDSSRNYTIAIGGDAYAKGGISIGESSQSTDGVTIGYLAKGTATDTIQLGSGTNSTANSFQINDDNIYKTKTHTLTVQNIEQDGNPVYGILSGDADPTTETVGKQFQFYVNTTSKKLFQCMSVMTTTEEPITTTYEWQTVGDETLAKQIQNNEVQIGKNNTFKAAGAAQDAYGTVSIGTLATGGTNSIALGYTANAGKGVRGVAIGPGAIVSSAGDDNITIKGKVQSGSNNISIGRYAIIQSQSNSIQLGAGINTQDNSFQINDDNIYKSDTHTLTVQNAQVNGTNVYGVLQGETDPTESTVGAVSQFYLNTASKALWQCVAITTTTDATTYSWQPVGGAGEKKYLHRLSWVYGTSASSILARADIISNSKEAFTEETLYNWLINNGYTSSTKYYIATGNQPVIQSAPPTNLGSWFIVGILANPNRPNKIWYQYGYTTGKYDTIKINNVSSYILNNLGAGNTNNTFSSPPTDTVVEL